MTEKEKKEKIIYDKYMKTGIYFFTAIGPVSLGLSEHRCWGWYKRLKDAKKAVEENHCDMNESLSYPYMVIEKVPNGACPIEMVEVAWYAWRGDEKTGGYKEIEKPDWSKGIICWSIS